MGIVAVILMVFVGVLPVAATIVVRKIAGPTVILAAFSLAIRWKFLQPFAGPFGLPSPIFWTFTGAVVAFYVAVFWLIFYRTCAKLFLNLSLLKPQQSYKLDK